MKRKQIKAFTLAIAVVAAVNVVTPTLKTFAISNAERNMSGVPDAYKEYAHIPDDNLRKYINEEYLYQDADAPIQIIQLRNLTMLRLPNRGIKDLTGLEHCVSLRQLFLAYNKITDITPLKNLKRLERVDVTNQIIDAKDVIATGDTAVVDNSILKDIDGKNITPLKDRSYTYDSKNNKVIFNNITETGKKTYKFNVPVEFGSRGYVYRYSGEVTQNIIK